MPEPAVLYTIGHSTHPYEDFLEMLRAHGIGLLADVRHFPGSRKFPQYNQQELAKNLESDGIKYQHFVDLGGRRRPLPDSVNTAWRHEAFRGYADYMQGEAFQSAALGLAKVSQQIRTAIMCSEAVWWRCHRAMISDYFKANGWTVLHIMGPASAKEHPYTAPARIVDGKLSYEPA